VEVQERSVDLLSQSVIKKCVGLDLALPAIYIDQIEHEAIRAFHTKMLFFVALYLAVITIKCDHGKHTMITAHCMTGTCLQKSKTTINHYNN